MKFSYSPELTTLLAKKQSKKVYYGMGIICLCSVLLIGAIPFVKTKETFSAVVELNISAQDRSLLVNDGGPTEATYPKSIPADMYLTTTNAGKLLVNQKIVFTQLNAKGYIRSFHDTIFNGRYIIVQINIIPESDISRQNLLKTARRKVNVYVVQNEMTLLNRIFK